MPKNERHPRMKPSERLDLIFKNQTRNKLPLGQLAAICVSFITFCLYLIGVVYHTSYLSEFNVASGMHPKSTQDIFIYAYSAILELGADCIDSFGRGGTVFILFLVMAVYVLALLLLFEFLSYLRTLQISIDNNSIRNSKAVKKLALFVLAPVLSASVPFILVMGLTTLLAVPPLIGKSAASMRVKKEKAAFEGGCERPKNIRLTCIEVVSGEKTLAQGFVIDASEKYVSLYENGKSITLPLTENIEVRQYVSKKISNVGGIGKRKPN
jgi:hypothetical protein